MTTVPDPSEAGSVSSAPAPSTPTYRAGGRDLALGVVIGAAVAVAVLLPAVLNAVTGSSILPALAESGLTVVTVLVAIVVVVWAVVDGIPAWRGRTPRGSVERTP